MKKWIFISLAIFVIVLILVIILLNLNQSGSKSNRDVKEVYYNSSDNSIPIDNGGIEIDVSCRKEKEECEKLGGLWGCKGMMCFGDSCNLTTYCNKPTSDVGKICTDSNQCESYCEAQENNLGKNVTGKCYKYEWASCMREVRNGTSGGMWCI